MNTREILSFRNIIWNYYKDNKRILPWRNIDDPYKVFVSEIMLQQTQVTRVLKKYPEFLSIFPSFESLAQAPTASLLSVWQGMGYNRRALYMRSAAAIIIKEYNGVLPQNPIILQTLPGVGKATAGSLSAFAYNLPTVFIETNIRRVFIHHFFADQDEVSDQQLLPLVEAAVDQDNPRDWYYALMDYGVMLAKKFGNDNKRSKHYSVQSKFEGSDRQIRGAVLKALVEGKKYSELSLISFLACDEDRGKKILKQMSEEGFICKENGEYRISQ